MIPIDNDVPMPDSMNSGRRKYPWRDMQIGESFFGTGMDIHSLTKSRSDAERRTGYKFTCRTVDGGVRVWRVK